MRLLARRALRSCDLVPTYGYDITPAELAVDRQIEHREVACAAFDLELRPDRPDVFGSQRWLCPRQLSLVPRHSLGCIHLILHGHTPRLGYRADKHEPPDYVSESGRFSGKSGLRVWPRGKRPVLLTQLRHRNCSRAAVSVAGEVVVFL
jgi:hypothetical protein